jgi:hypothetical protein
MPNSTPIPAPKRLSRDLAARVLDRAATLDATEDKVDVATLRAAAFDAGISPEAFERALAEAAVAARESARESARVSPSVQSRTRIDGYEVAVRTMLVGLATGIVAIGGAFLAFGPDETAAAGAAFGGGGALVGVFIHLLNRFRNRNE